MRNGANSMLAPFNFGGFRGTNMADATSDTDAVTKRQLVASSPVGIVVDYAGSTAPTGWLLCYGQAISRSDYADLFEAIGTTHGTGDGSTTFNVPDYRGRTSAGMDNMGGTAASRLTTAGSGVNGASLGASGGDETHTLTIDEMPAHDHEGTATAAGAHTHTYSQALANDYASAGGPPDRAVTFTTGTTSQAPAHTHPLDIEVAGGGDPHNNVQPTIVVNKIIRAVA